MRRPLRSLCLLLTLLPAAWSAGVPLTQDSFFSPGSPSNYGSVATINVGTAANSQGLVQFDLTTLPAGATGALVAKATLTLYVNRVATAGSLNIDVANGTWTESAVNGNNAPLTGAAVLHGISLSTSNVIVAIDVTQAVRNWIDGVAPNNGFLLSPGAPGLSVLFDSKESTTTSHPATLDIVLTGPAGPAGPTGPQGPTGPVADPANNSLALGGVAAASYARRDTVNTFSQAQTLSTSVTVPILYDLNDPSYYLDPNSTSRLNNLRFNTADCLNGFCPPNGAVRFTPNMHLNANNGNAVIVNWDNGALPGNNTQQFRIGNGQGGDAFYFTSAGYGIGSYINTSDNLIGGGVTGVIVKQGDNYHRTANASAVAAFVNNSCGSSNNGPTCASPDSIGTLNFGASNVYNASCPAGGSPEHWYRVAFSLGGSYHPRVNLTAGAAYYTVDVFRDDCDTPIQIQGTSWETTSTGVLSPGTFIRVRVRPYTSSPACVQYSLQLANF